jgi:hypothetical protein
MFELDALAKMGLQGWPLVAGIAIVCVSIVAWCIGEWPWKGIIVHKHYDSRRKRNEEDNED